MQPRATTELAGTLTLGLAGIPPKSVIPLWPCRDSLPPPSPHASWRTPRFPRRTHAIPIFPTPTPISSPKPTGPSPSGRRASRRCAPRSSPPPACFPPFPKNDLHPQIFGRVANRDCTIEKVLIETLPGFYLAGNLYRPLQPAPPGGYPAIISPHGHWNYGRLENTDIVSVPARAINLARQGFVVFSYDMVGYDDTIQTPHDFGDTPRRRAVGLRPVRPAVVELDPRDRFPGEAARRQSAK